MGKQIVLQDPELKALSGSVALLELVPKEGRSRVLEYLNERYIDGLGKTVEIPAAHDVMALATQQC